MGLRRVTIVTFAASCFGLVAGESIYAAATCSPSIAPSPPIPFGPRGSGNSTRCEGFFKAQIAGRLFDLVSFTKGLPAIPPQNVAEIQLAPDVPVQSELTIVARSISASEFYQMSASVAPGNKLVWPLNDVVLQQNGPRSQIGLLGHFIESDGTQVFVALAGANAATSDIQFRVRTTATVLNLKMRWRPDDASGVYVAWNLIKKKAQAGEVIDLNLSALPVGRQFIEIAGTPSNSSVATSIGIHLVR